MFLIYRAFEADKNNCYHYFNDQFKTRKTHNCKKKVLVGMKVTSFFF